MEPLRIIRTYDMALDVEAMQAAGQWEDFLEQRDPKFCLFNEGELPTVFIATWPTRRQIDSWDGLSAKETHKAAFRECVRSVEHMLYPDGSRRTWSKPGDPTRRMRDDALELFAPADVQQVGQVIWAHGFFPRDRPLYVPLLASCQVAMIGRGVESQRRRAALMRQQAAASSAADKPPPEEPPPATP